MRLMNDLVRAAAMVCLCGFLIQAGASAQTSRERGRRDPAPTAEALKSRLSKAEEMLVDEYKEVVEEFYKQGDKEGAMQLLHRLKELNPKLQGLDDKIKEISEELMQENEADFDLDTRKSWEQIGEVAEGKAFRLMAAGDYKMTYTTTVTVDGLQPDEETKDYTTAAPLGCLIGVIVSEGKPGKPFPVKSELEHTPKKSGTLYLKVNVPEGTKCVGRLKVKVSGYISTGREK